MRVLVIEDEAKIAGFVAKAFAEESWKATIARDGEEGLAMALAGGIDLVVLDVMLPKLDGFQVLAALRARRTTLPVIMLTARDGVEDKVRGLDLGADDYLAKPFSIDELLARARALLRRSAGPEGILKLGDLELDRNHQRVTRAGQPIDLTRREFALLEYLLESPGQVASRRQIAERVWGMDFDSGTNNIDVYIKYLRDKVDAGFPRKLIKTVRGRGYTLEAGS